jgi:hypothetical protein
VCAVDSGDRESRCWSRLAIFAAIALMAIVVVAWCASSWRFMGWSRRDEVWVPIPASGMQELHTTFRVRLILQGRIEASRTESISAVIPIGSAGADEPRHETSWVWQPAAPTRVWSWDDRWHLSRWNEWRLGDFGWYETAGGGSVSRVFSLPLWMALAVLGTPCWLGIARAVRAGRRRRRGRCAACGYDRRGIAVESACPECGTHG